MNRQQLYQVPVPRKTDTYSPVPHKEVLEYVEEELYKNNLTARNIKLNDAREGKQLIGHMDIASSGNDDLGMRLAFRNSYDKSMSVAFVAGACVWICSNGMISGDIKFMRKHTGTVLTELKDKIEEAVGELAMVFDKSLKHSEAMKAIHVDKQASAELCGRLFIEQDIITATQLSAIKKEINDPSHVDFKPENAWSVYNHITASLKEAHPSKYFKQHMDVHHFFEEQFQLV